jgi:hypothetical protein
MRAKSDDNIQKCRENILTAKHKVKLLQQHLRAWDKSHDNAINRGYTLRKEMDKIHGDTIYRSPDQKLEDIIGKEEQSAS